MAEWVTGAELARRAGVGRSAITEAKKAGRVKPRRDGKYDAAKALQALVDTQQRPPGPGRSGKRGGSAEPEKLVFWKTAEAREDAKKKRLQRLELQGALVRRAAIDIAWATRAAQVRDQLMQLGPRLGGRLAAETDPQACAQIVTDEVLVALRAISVKDPDGQ